MPLFSATKILPSSANFTEVGEFSPLKTTDSWNPDGSVVAPVAVTGGNSKTSTTEEARATRTTAIAYRKEERAWRVPIATKLISLRFARPWRSFMSSLHCKRYFSGSIYPRQETAHGPNGR